MISRYSRKLSFLSSRIWLIEIVLNVPRHQNGTFLHDATKLSAGIFTDITESGAYRSVNNNGNSSTVKMERNPESNDSSVSQTEPERRFIDGKWFCEDGSGSFLVFEEDKWIAANGDDLKKKWDAAGTASDTSDNPYRCVVNGVTMEWNHISQQWLPMVEVNDDFLAQYHSNYGIKYDFGEKEGSSIEGRSEKSEVHRLAKHKLHDKKEQQGWVELEEQRNTSIYVSNLPLTITEESFIKESVIMALDILDGWNVDGKIISVEKAKFEMKGEFDPAKKKKKLTAAQKKRFIEKKPRNYRPISDCTIVMKNMFTMEQMMKNATLLLDLEEEVRKVCERFGTVKKVVIHDNNPEGVICVTFQNVEHSDTAVRSLNGRVVDGRQISVALWDGKTKYTV
ncbi:unnamed protein product [Litomosoides sigmodontis]|uniref:RRM domain-containing protein n=1 Tax=Litomosoides sigmodontis TaxID=42156 RepID=A0A3P6T9E8_LITSI|nr:unnamed protein product [Litomosoides sigmodontis]